MFQEVTSLYAQISISELHLGFDFYSAKSKRLVAFADEIQSSGGFPHQREREKGTTQEHFVRPSGLATATLPQTTHQRTNTRLRAANDEQQDEAQSRPSDDNGIDQPANNRMMSDYVVVALRRITKSAVASASTASAPTTVIETETGEYSQCSKHSEIVAISNPVRIPKLSRRETGGDSLDQSREAPDEAERARIVISLGPTPLQHVEERCVDAFTRSLLPSSSTDGSEHNNNTQRKKDRTSQIEVAVYQLPEPQHLHFCSSAHSLHCGADKNTSSSSIMNAQRESERQIQMRCYYAAKNLSSGSSSGVDVDAEYGTRGGSSSVCCYDSPPPPPMDVAMLSVDGLPVPNITPETLALLQLLDRFESDEAGVVRNDNKPFRVLARGVVLDFEGSQNPSRQNNGKLKDRTCSQRIPPAGETLFRLRTTTADSLPQSPHITHASIHHHEVPPVPSSNTCDGEESGVAYIDPANPQLAEVSLGMDVQYFGNGGVKGGSSSRYCYHSTLGEILRESLLKGGLVQSADRHGKLPTVRQAHKRLRGLPNQNVTAKRVVEVVSISVEAEGEGADLITAMATKASLSMGQGCTATDYSQSNGKPSDVHCPHVEQHVPKVLVSDGNGLWVSTSFDCEMPAASVLGAISSGAQGGGTAAEAIAKALLDPRSRDLRQASAALSSWLQSAVPPLRTNLRDNRFTEAPLRYAKRRVATPFVSLVGVGVEDEQQSHHRRSGMSEARREGHTAKRTTSTKRRRSNGWEASLRRQRYRRERFLSTVYAVAVMEPTAPQSIAGVNTDCGVNISCGLPVADVQRHEPRPLSYRQRQNTTNTTIGSRGYDSRLADVPRLPIATVKFTNADLHRWIVRDKLLRATSSNSNSDAAHRAENDDDDGSESSFVGRMLYEGHGAGEGGRLVFFDERVGGIVKIEETTCEIAGPSHGNTVLRISVEMSRAANEEEMNNRLRESETDELVRAEAYAAALSAVTTTATDEHPPPPLPPPPPESLNAIATRRAVKNASILHNETRYSVVMIAHAMPSWLAAIRGDEIKENELNNLFDNSNRGERSALGWLSVLEGARGRARRKRAERRAVARKAIAPFATSGESLVARWMFRVERWRSAFTDARLRTPMTTESGDGTFLDADANWSSEDSASVSSDGEERSERDAFSIFDSVPVNPIGSSALVVRTHTDALMRHAVAAGANYTVVGTEYSTEPRVEKLPPNSSMSRGPSVAHPAFGPSYTGRTEEHSYSDRRYYASPDRPLRESDGLYDDYGLQRNGVEERWIPSPPRTDGRNDGQQQKQRRGGGLVGTPTPRQRREPPNPNDSAFVEFSPLHFSSSTRDPRTPTRAHNSYYHDQRGIGGVGTNEPRPKEAPSILYSPHANLASSHTPLRKQREMHAASSIRAQTGYFSTSLPQEGYAAGDMYSAAAAGDDGLLFSVNREPRTRPIREHERHLSPLSHRHYLVSQPSLLPPPLPSNSSLYNEHHEYPHYRGLTVHNVHATANPLDGLQMGDRNVQLARGGIGPLSSVTHRQAALAAEKTAEQQELHHQHRMGYDGIVVEPALPPIISNPTPSSLSILNRTLQSMGERMAENNTEGSRSVDYLKMRANHNHSKNNIGNKSTRGGGDSKMLRSGTTRTDVLDEYGLGASAPAAANSLFHAHAHGGGALAHLTPSLYPPLITSSSVSYLPANLTVDRSLQSHHYPNYLSPFPGAVATTPYTYARVPPPRTAEEASLRTELDTARSQHLVRTMLSAEEDSHPTMGSTQHMHDHTSRTTERYASAYYGYEAHRLGGGDVSVPSKFGPAASRTSSLLPPAQNYSPRTLPLPLPESMSLAPSDVLFMMCLLFPNEMLECAPLYYTALFAEGSGKQKSGSEVESFYDSKERGAHHAALAGGAEERKRGAAVGERSNRFRIDSLDAASRESVESYVRNKSTNGRRGDALKLFQRLFLLLPSAANEEDGSVRMRGRKRGELFCVENGHHNLREYEAGAEGGGGRPKMASYFGPEEGKKELLRVLSLPHFASEASFSSDHRRHSASPPLYSSLEPLLSTIRRPSIFSSLFTSVVPRGKGKAARMFPRRNLITHLFSCPEVEALMSSLLGVSSYEFTISSSFSSSQLRTKLERSHRYAWSDEDVAARAWLLLGVFLLCFFPSILIYGAAGVVALKFGLLSLSSTWRWLRGGGGSPRRWTGSIVETTTSASSFGRSNARRRSSRRRINVLGGLASLFFLSSPLSQSEVDLLSPMSQQTSSSSSSIHSTTRKTKRSSSRSSRRALPFEIHLNFISKISSLLLMLLYGLDNAKKRIKLAFSELVDNNLISRVPEEVFLAIRGLKILFCIFPADGRKNNDGNVVTFIDGRQDDAGDKPERKTHVKYEMFLPKEEAEFEEGEGYNLGSADGDAGDDLVDVVLDGSVSTSIAINSGYPQGNPHQLLEYDTLPLERMLLGSLANSHPHFYQQYSSALSRNLAYLQRMRYYGPTKGVGVGAVSDPYTPYHEPYYANTLLNNNNNNFMQPPLHHSSQPHHAHSAPVDSTYTSPLAPRHGHDSYLTPMLDPVDHYPRRRYLHRHDDEADISRTGVEVSTTNFNGQFYGDRHLHDYPTGFSSVGAGRGAAAASVTAAEHLAARAALRTTNSSVDASLVGYSRDRSLLPYYLRNQLSAPTLAPLPTNGVSVSGPRSEARRPYVGTSAPTAMNSALFDLSRSCASYRLYTSLGLLTVGRTAAGGGGEKESRRSLPSPHFISRLEVLSKILFVAIVKGRQQSDRLGIRRGQEGLGGKTVSEGQGSIPVLQRVRNFVVNGRCAPLWILLFAFASAFVLSVYVMLWRLQISVGVYAFLVSVVVLAPHSPVALMVKVFLRLLLTAEELA